jgi:dTMP kinase
MIIVLEGLDNSGKTTQSILLSQKLSDIGYDIIISKELSTDIGELLKKSFKTKKYSPIVKTLLFAADRQVRLEIIKNHPFTEKSLVIFDRYIHSAIVYRVCEGIEEEWVKIVNRFNPTMDIGFYIDISPEESVKRNTNTKYNIHYTLEQLNKIRNSYLFYVNNGDLIQIDGNRNRDKICEQISELIINKINENGNTLFGF